MNVVNVVDSSHVTNPRPYEARSGPHVGEHRRPKNADGALKIETPPAMIPLLEPSRYKGAFGGRGGTKSWGFADNLIERLVMEPSTRAVCIREIQKSLKQSVKRLIEDRIKTLHVGHLFEITDKIIRRKVGGGFIVFEGMQDHTAESIKSLEGFDIAWVEEAQSLSQRSLDLLRPTIRKQGSELWFSWNPRFAKDPVDTFLRGPNPPPDSIVVEVNFRDNPWLPDTLKTEIEYDRRRDPEKFQHVWLGGYEMHSEARVFRNWRVEEFETPPYEADSPDSPAFLFGGDWGFSVDPTVLVRGFIQERNLFIDWEVYRVGCEIDHTPALFDTLGCEKQHPHKGECKGMARQWKIITDSARPETISYMQRHGYARVEGARKGPGSVEEGIQFLKSYDIVVHPRCTHAIDELTLYSYKTHPLTGEIMPILSDRKNHVIDSLRYMVEPLNNEKEWFVR